MKFRFLLSPDDGGGEGGGGGTLLSAPSTTPAAPAAPAAPQPGTTPTVPDFIHEKFKGSANPLEEQAKAYVEAQKLLGQRQQVKPPGPDAKPEEITAWRKTLGVPDDVAGYGLKKPDKLPEGVEWDEEQVGKFGALAHKMGLTPAQAQELIAFDTERMGAMSAKGKAGLETFVKGQRDELVKEWGDKFDNNKERAVMTAKLLGLDPNDAEIGNSAKMIKALFSASQLIKEDQFVGSEKAGLGLTGKDQADDILHNKNNPWHKAFMGEEGKERQAQAQAFRNRLLGVKE